MEKRFIMLVPISVSYSDVLMWTCTFFAFPNDSCSYSEPL